jgi:phosphatidylserine decarboxylase
MAREGLRFVIPGAVLVLVAAVLGWYWLAAVLAVVTVAVASFFRDPERQVPSDERAVVAPADGRVLKAGVVEDSRFLQAPVQMVSIFMSPLNVHVNRNPISGRVVDIRYHSGRYFRAFAEKASLDNEQNAIIVEDEQARRVAFVQIAGFIARRIVCYLRPNMPVERGARCGLIMFGSRVDVFLPADAELRVQVGAKTRAGETVIAQWMK